MMEIGVKTAGFWTSLRGGLCKMQTSPELWSQLVDTCRRHLIWLLSLPSSLCQKRVFWRMETASDKRDDGDQLYLQVINAVHWRQPGSCYQSPSLAYWSLSVELCYHMLRLHSFAQRSGARRGGLPQAYGFVCRACPSAAQVHHPVRLCFQCFYAAECTQKSLWPC